MYLQCRCGNVMNDVASPNQVEHHLLNSYAKEKLQDLADEEVAAEGEIGMWAEHWDESGAINVWRCPVCERLYLNALGAKKNITVYKIEKKGLDQ